MTQPATRSRASLRRTVETLFVRNMLLGPLLERFLVASVVSLLAIRLYLVATGFPQVGGGGLHLAHMLWGGLLMLVAIVLLLAFLGRRIQYVAAVVGGIGFGTFIDELGKFLTSDNNYFFQPAIAIIYIIFVLLFLAFRTLGGPERFSERQLLANALEEVEALVLGDVGAEMNPRALRALQAAGSTNPVLAALVEALQRPGVMRHDEPGWLDRMEVRAGRLYQRFVASRWFFPSLILCGVGYILLFVPTLYASLSTVTLHPTSVAQASRPGVAALSLLAFSLTSGIMTAIGLVATRRSLPVAYQWLKRAVLVSILLVQVPLFYLQQFGALAELTLSVLALVAINYLILGERLVARPKHA
jgi:hypothetical protein